MVVVVFRALHDVATVLLVVLLLFAGRPFHVALGLVWPVDWLAFDLNCRVDAMVSLTCQTFRLIPSMGRLDGDWILDLRMVHGLHHQIVQLAVVVHLLVLCELLLSVGTLRVRVILIEVLDNIVIEGIVFWTLLFLFDSQSSYLRLLSFRSPFR